MKTLPLDYYLQWPLARKAVIFLDSAKTSNEIQNRTIGSHEVAFYLLSHSVELVIKAVAMKELGIQAPFIHDKQTLSETYKNECNFSKSELLSIKRLKELNNGQGGLRYENEPIGEFLPSIFNENTIIVERLIAEHFQ